MVAFPSPAEMHKRLNPPQTAGGRWRGPGSPRLRADRPDPGALGETSVDAAARRRPLCSSAVSSMPRPAWWRPKPVLSDGPTAKGQGPRPGRLLGPHPATSPARRKLGVKPSPSSWGWSTPWYVGTWSCPPVGVLEIRSADAEHVIALYPAAAAGPFHADRPTTASLELMHQLVTEDRAETAGGGMPVRGGRERTCSGRHRSPGAPLLRTAGARRNGRVQGGRQAPAGDLDERDSAQSLMRSLPHRSAAVDPGKAPDAAHLRIGRRRVANGWPRSTASMPLPWLEAYQTRYPRSWRPFSGGPGTSGAWTCACWGPGRPVRPGRAGALGRVSSAAGSHDAGRRGAGTTLGRRGEVARSRPTPRRQWRPPPAADEREIWPPLAVEPNDLLTPTSWNMMSEVPVGRADSTPARVLCRTHIQRRRNRHHVLGAG